MGKKIVPAYRTLMIMLMMVFIATGCSAIKRSNIVLEQSPTSASGQQGKTPVPVGYHCPTCQVEPIVEYVDVEVPECIKAVSMMDYQPGCTEGGCDRFPVLVRTTGLDTGCGSKASIEVVQAQESVQ